jgi:hypothetical protein
MSVAFSACLAWRGHSCPRRSLAGKKADRNVRPTRSSSPTPCPPYTISVLHWLDPEPRIFFRSLYRASSYWILPNVVDLLLHALFVANHVIERFFLPERSTASQCLIHTAGRCAFDPFQYVEQAERVSIWISHRSEQQVYMFWHDHGRRQMKSGAVSSQATPENLVATSIRKRRS